MKIKKIHPLELEASLMYRKLQRSMTPLTFKETDTRGSCEVISLSDMYIEFLLVEDILHKVNDTHMYAFIHLLIPGTEIHISERLQH
jgi:hypothetical protein